ncbi:hypothetical protein KIN20_030782 [Parelaphostrongylus tenuis]|uniref:7TM GPCR serpentine receptor class x (Srx) domain-containing protein n=1 Tax=Parelaphostrongylus tenuis TaxID=148309 RepID=A0AAD5R4H7_PARTN|nr:hypothetical protein KIN20_030782 [Parelaphostrongylus tenuis]
MTFAMALSNTSCGYMFSLIDFYSVLTVLILIFLLDCTTSICLRVKHSGMTSHNFGAIHADIAQQKRLKVEIRFFKQALCENALFVLQHISYHCISPLSENRLAAFMTSTLAWELCIALDGFIIVLYHFRFSYFKKTSPTTLTVKVQSVKIPSK